LTKWRLPDDPARVLGGRIRKKKDKRPLDFDVQVGPGHLRDEIKKKQPNLKGSYRKQQLARIRLECLKNRRTIISPVLRDLIIEHLRSKFPK